jgi:hypothetical protein
MIAAPEPCQAQHLGDLAQANTVKKLAILTANDEVAKAFRDRKAGPEPYMTVARFKTLIGLPCGF